MFSIATAFSGLLVSAATPALASDPCTKPQDPTGFQSGDRCIGGQVFSTRGYIKNHECLRYRLPPLTIYNNAAFCSSSDTQKSAIEYIEQARVITQLGTFDPRGGISPGTEWEVKTTAGRADVTRLNAAAGRHELYELKLTSDGRFPGTEDQAGGYVTAMNAKNVFPAVAPSSPAFGLLAGWRDALVQAINDAGASGFTDIVTKTYTVGQLENARDDILDDVSDLVSAGKVGGELNIESNGVTITVATGLTSTDLGRVATARSGVAVPSTVVTDPATSLLVDEDVCNTQSCDAPLRGGVLVIARKTSHPNSDCTTPGECAGCTSGFTAVRPADNSKYLITAAHCFDETGSNTWYMKRASAAGSATVGVPANKHNAASGDFGLIQLTSSEFTGDLKPYVYVARSGEGGDDPGTRRDTTYDIRTARYNKKGFVACYTGTTSGSVCGEVTKVGATRGTTGGLAKWEAYECGRFKDREQAVRDGDSGGPVFKKHKALGVMKGHQPGNNCLGYYSGARVAEDVLNVKILTTP